MRHLRKLLLGATAMVAVLAFAVPAAAQANLVWENEGEAAGWGHLNFVGGGISFTCEAEPQGTLYNSGGSASGTISAVSFECGATSIPNCEVNSATAKSLPWSTSYTGSLASGVTAQTSGVRIDFDLSESCEAADFFLSGNISGSVEQGGGEHTVHYSGVQDLKFNGSGGSWAVNGELTYEAFELEEEAEEPKDVFWLNEGSAEGGTMEGEAFTFHFSGLAINCGSVATTGEFYNSAGKAEGIYEGVSLSCGGTNLPGCTVKAATAENLPWITTYSGGNGFPVIAQTHEVKISFAFTEGCKKYGVPDFFVSGDMTGTLQQGGGEHVVTYENDQGLRLWGTGGYGLVNGSLVYEGYELENY